MEFSDLWGAHWQARDTLLLANTEKVFHSMRPLTLTQSKLSMMYSSYWKLNHSWQFIVLAQAIYFFLLLVMQLWYVTTINGLAPTPCTDYSLICPHPEDGAFTHAALKLRAQWTAGTKTWQDFYSLFLTHLCVSQRLFPTVLRTKEKRAASTCEIMGLILLSLHECREPTLLWNGGEGGWLGKAERE